MDKIAGYTAKKSVRGPRDTPIILHAVLIAQQVQKSVAVEIGALLLLAFNICLQTAIRMSPIEDGAFVTTSLTNSHSGPVIIFLLTVLPCLFMFSSIFIPELCKWQAEELKLDTINNGLIVYVLAHTANLYLLTPISAGLVIGALLMCYDTTDFGMLNISDIVSKYSLYGLSVLAGTLLMAYFTWLYLGISRSRDVFSCTSRLPPLVQSVTLCLAVATECLKPASTTSRTARSVLLTVTIGKALWVVPSLLMGVRQTHFHSDRYRIITLLGMLLTTYQLALDIFSTLADIRTPQGFEITGVLVVIVLSTIWLKNNSHKVDLSDTTTMRSKIDLARLESKLWSQSRDSTLSAEEAIFGMLCEGINAERKANSKGYVEKNEPKGFLSSSSSRKEKRAKYFADYLLKLYSAKYTAARLKKGENWSIFQFAHFLLKWKKHVYLLSSIYRTLASSQLSLQDQVSLAILEMAISQQLRTQDDQFSYFFPESYDPSKLTKRLAHKFNPYYVVSAVSAYQRLVEHMHAQIQLQSQFLTAIDGKTQPVSLVHDAVAAITQQRARCKRLFDALHAEADPAQTFHLLPFAFFLEHTENNLERRVELVKAYHFKSQVRRSQGMAFTDLLDRSVTVVTESDRLRLGHISHSSKNSQLVFGADAPTLEGRSLDIFFHPEMAAAHRRQMRDYMQHFDTPYLGEHRERYVTVGNHVYYRVDCVTKLVPHLQEGFQFVTLVKHLSDDSGKYGKADASSFQLVLDDKLHILGVGYNQSLVKNGLLRHSPPVKESLESPRLAPTNMLKPRSVLDLVGKRLSSVSDEVAFAVQEKFEEIHTTERPAERPTDRAALGMQIVINGPELQPLESVILQEGIAKLSNLVAVEEQEEGAAIESGNFVAKYFKEENFGINFDMDQDSDSSLLQPNDFYAAEGFNKTKTRTRITLMLNFTHWCLNKVNAERTNVTINTEYSMKHSIGDTLGKDVTSINESMHKRMGTTSGANMDTLRVNDHGGLTILRFKSPTNSDISNYQSMQRSRSSVVDNAIQESDFVDFDPVSLLRNFISHKIDLKAVGTTREQAYIDEESPLGFEKVQIATRGSVVANYNNNYSSFQSIKDPTCDSPTNIGFTKAIDLLGPPGASKRDVNKGLSTPRPEALIAQSGGSANISRHVSESSSDPEADLESKLRKARRTNQDQLEHPKNLTFGGSSARPCLTPGFQGQTTTKTDKIPLNKVGPSKMRSTMILPQKTQIQKKSGILFKTKFDQRSKIHGSKKDLTKEMALSVGGASSTASQTSEINTNRTIMSMIMYPSVNRINKFFVAVCAFVFWVFCHVFQSYMESQFISEFEGMAHLQNLFGLFISFDSYVKDTAINVLETQLTKERFGFDPGRFAEFNPSVTDIVAASKAEVMPHFQGAQKLQLDMIGNLTLLTQDEVERFLADSVSLLNISIPGTIGSRPYTTLGPYKHNVLEKSLMVLYDLRVWNEDAVRYGSWAASQFYVDSIDTWSKLVVRMTKSFEVSYTTKVKDLEFAALAISIGGICTVQILIGLIFWQIKGIRDTLEGIINVVRVIKRQEIECKLERIKLLGEYLANNFYVGSKSKESMSTVVEQIYQVRREGREALAMRNSRQSNSSSQLRGSVASRSSSKYWFEMAVWFLSLFVLMEVQAGINIATSVRQRAVAEQYLEWLKITEEYYLFIFHLNTIPTALYMETAGKLGLYLPIESLSDRMGEFTHDVAESAKAFVSDLQGKQQVAQTYGFQKFFQNPCDVVDLSIYNLPKDSCKRLNSGVINDGYIRFLDVDRLHVERLLEIYKSEHAADPSATTKSETFRSILSNLKNIHQPLFPLVHHDLIEAAERFQRFAKDYYEVYGLGIQISLTVLSIAIVLIWRLVADAKLSTAVSVYLILPAESLALNPYVKLQLKSLKEQGK